VEITPVAPLSGERAFNMIVSKEKKHNCPDIGQKDDGENPGKGGNRLPLPLQGGQYQSKGKEITAQVNDV
jgi:hypothetical protein